MNPAGFSLAPLLPLCVACDDELPALDYAAYQRCGGRYHPSGCPTAASPACGGIRPRRYPRCDILMPPLPCPPLLAPASNLIAPPFRPTFRHPGASRNRIPRNFPTATPCPRAMRG